MGQIINFPGSCHQVTVQNEISIELASHWICRELAPQFTDGLTIGKAYKVLYNDLTDEFYMLDDFGSNTVWWIVVAGNFIKM